mgnify:CR=1 FL=1
MIVHLTKFPIKKIDYCLEILAFVNEIITYICH